VDAFLTAVYVINRLSTPVIQYKSPYFKLYNRELDYQKLRVFGCLCYPLLRPYGSHKLEYRSKLCIFIGYNYACYKCLDPVTNKAYLSKHVVFNEDSFPAKDQATSHLPSKKMLKVRLLSFSVLIFLYHMICLLHLILLQKFYPLNIHYHPNHLKLEI
jgi:hypothetical protein